MSMRRERVLLVRAAKQSVCFLFRVCNVPERLRKHFLLVVLLFIHNIKIFVLEFNRLK